VLTMLLTLPLAPVRGVTALGRLLQRQAERQLYDPTAVSRQLAEVDEAAATGELSAEEAAERQQEILDRLID
jgi:hypothetical protein